MRRLSTALLSATLTAALLAGLLPLTALADPTTPQAISFGALADRTYGDAPFAISASTDSGLEIAFTSQTAGVCSVVPDAFTADPTTATVTILHSGTCTIEASQGGDETYLPVTPVPQSFTVAKATNTVTAADQAITYGDQDPAFTFAYGAWKDGDTAAVVTTAPTCSVSGAHSDVSGSPYAIACAGAAAADYTFTYADGQLTVAKADPSFTLSAPDAPYDGSPHGATGSAHGVGGPGDTLTPTTIAYTGTGGTTYGPSAAAPTAAGSYSAKIEYAGSANYSAGSSSAAYAIGQAAQTISFDLSGVTGKAFGDDPFSIAGTATASSGLAVGLASQTASVCTVSGTTVTLAGAGTCTIRASQPGDADHAAAPSVDQSFGVATATPTCTVSGYAVTWDGTPHTATGSCTGVGGASLAGLDLSGTTHADAGTYAADPWSFTDASGDYGSLSGTVADSIAKAPQTVAFTSADPSPVNRGDTFTPTASASSGLPVAITVDPASSAVCSISGLGVVTIDAPSGTCVLDADQAGDGNRLAAPRQQMQVTVANRKPVCAPASADVVMNVALSGTADCSDPDGTAIAGYAVATDGALGHATIDASGRWTYTPVANAVPADQTSVADSFTIVASDGAADSDPATISVTISNHPVSGSLQIQHVGALTATVLDVLADPMVSPGQGDTGQPLAITSVTQGSSGSVSTDGRTVSYRPSGCSTAIDAFTFTFSDGRTSAAVTVAVIVDRPGANGPPTAPLTSVPAVSLVAGSTIGSTVPVRISWCGVVAGDTTLSSYRMVQSINAGRTWAVTVPGTTATAWTVGASTAYPYIWGVRAIDRLGRSAEYTRSPVTRVALIDSASSALAYRGPWSLTRSSVFSGGSERYATSTSASVTYRTAASARMFGIVGSMGRGRGAFQVFVDGTLVATVSDRAPSTVYRRVIYARALSPGVSHTIVIRPAGTGRVDLDALLTVQ